MSGLNIISASSFVIHTFIHHFIQQEKVTDMNDVKAEKKERKKQKYVRFTAIYSQ